MGANGLTHADIAQRLGVSRSVVTRYLADERGGLTLGAAIRLAKAVGLRMAFTNTRQRGSK